MSRIARWWGLSHAEADSKGEMTSWGDEDGPYYDYDDAVEAAAHQAIQTGHVAAVADQETGKADKWFAPTPKGTRGKWW